MNSAKQSNSSIRKSNSSIRRDRRSRSKSNNNIKNPNKVPLVRRDQPVSRNRSRSRGKPMRDDKSKVSKRISRSNSRTKSIQEKLLMLSQNQAQPSTKENFATRKKSRSVSIDHNKNANKVPLARKDRNQVSRNRSRSGSRNKIRTRTRSRSDNRISRPRDFQSRSPVRRGRSPPMKKDDLSQINNRLLNLAHDQYGEAGKSSREDSEDNQCEIKEKHKKDKKKKKKKKKKKSSS